MTQQSIGGASVTPSTHVRDLGVIVDSGLTFNPHINQVTRTCYFRLRQLRLIRRSLTTGATHALVRALVHSRLDYCNGALAGLPKYHNDRLQSVLRLAARLVLRLPSR